MEKNELLSAIKNDVEKEIEDLTSSWGIDKTLKVVLLEMERLFNDFEGLPNFKEAIAEELSFLLYMKLDNKTNLDIHEMFFLDLSQELEEKDNLYNTLFSLFEVRNIIRDMEVYCLKQNYYIENNKHIELSHPIKDYEHFYKLGYLLNNLESNALTANAHLEIQTSMYESLINIEEEYSNMFGFKIVDRNTVKERIEFEFSPDNVGQLYKIITTNHGSMYSDLISKYFDNSQIDIEDKCLKKGQMRWIDLFNFSIVIQYISTYISKVIKENAISNRMKHNSQFLAMPNEQFKEFFIRLFKQINADIREKEIRNFLTSFIININNNTKRIDLQFSPIINFGHVKLILINTFAKTDIFRAYIQNNNITLDDQGNKFENEIFSLLKKGFPEVDIFRSIKYQNQFNQKGEIDLCFMINKNIYFIECKNPKLPISSSSSTNNYLYIQKAKEQLENAENYFHENKNLFLSKHLKYNDKNDEVYNLHKIIVLSNRNVSGLNFSGIAVRDIFSLNRLILSGNISSFILDDTLTKKDVQEISLYENKKYFQEKDFLNYIDEDFIFYQEINKFLRKFSRTLSYKGYKISTYDYYMDYKS